MPGALSHIRVLDLSRHLAGPWAGQMLADFGAEVIKVERPGAGDDVRSFGPPFLKDRDGRETKESPFFFAANRGKKSVTIDISRPEGQEIVKRLAAKSDVVLENYKVGTLERYGLAYRHLKAIRPDIVYCSITGFGQTGPYRDRAGYDFIFQAMGGLMSITGLPDGEPGGGPLKTSMAVADLMTGMYASIAVLTALVHRSVSGLGQHIDLALLDAQVAALTVENLRYLLLGEIPQRIGNVSRNLVPTQSFGCQDGHMVISVGNDGQFAKLAEVLERPELARDDRFATNAARRRNRDALIPMLDAMFRQRPVKFWVESLGSAGIPCGPVNDIKQVFEEPQVVERGMRVEVSHPVLGAVPLVANPVRFSETAIQYRSAPPTLGEHTHAVLIDLLGLEGRAIDDLARKGVI